MINMNNILIKIHNLLLRLTYMHTITTFYLYIAMPLKILPFMKIISYCDLNKFRF